MKYNETILDYFHNPRNVGNFPIHAPKVHTAQAGDYSRGDIIQLQVKCDAGIILDTRFKAYGTVPTIAVGSFLCEWMPNKSIEEAIKNLKAQDIMTILQLPTVKLYCALLGEDVLRKVYNSCLSNRPK